MSAGEIFLRDVIDIPESVHAGDFKVELSGGFRDTRSSRRRVRRHRTAASGIQQGARIVRAAVRSGSSHAAYLHGSFGSGKSHFLTVLHAILNNDPAARAKPGLQSVIADHDGWLRGRKFLMVPYHLVGATDLGSAVLGGYVATVRRLHPDAPTPPVYRADAMLTDARRQREFLADDAKFVAWLGTGSASGLDVTARRDSTTSMSSTQYRSPAGPQRTWTGPSLPTPAIRDATGWCPPCSRDRCPPTSAARAVTRTRSFRWRTVCR